ncbi:MULTISPECIES: hypothetical protein [Rhodococcus]|uniref:hypothetical protein n=1 Tax=Rhodococcus TaxID=1827 RepID=UPI001179FDF5|nr:MULTISPECIES: hypothetical protein [Rhodococcus]MCC4303985.1 hypothetical protein [Rhodococcus sp. 3-2]
MSNYAEKRFEYNEYLARLDKEQLIWIINKWMDTSEDDDLEDFDSEEELQEIIEIATEGGEQE